MADFDHRMEPSSILGSLRKALGGSDPMCVELLRDDDGALVVTQR